MKILKNQRRESTMNIQSKTTPFRGKYSSAKEKVEEKKKNLRETFEGYRTEKEEKKAREILERAYCFHEGEGVKRNMHEAVDLYRRAAELGNVEALLASLIQLTLSIWRFF